MMARKMQDIDSEDSIREVCAKCDLSVKFDSDLCVFT